MPKKHSDDTIYVKKDGKYVAAGKWFDRDHLGFGNFFINNTKYSRGYHCISASPDPDFITLETAIEESREELRMALRNIMMDYSKQAHLHDFYTVDIVIQAIRKTFLDKKKKMVDIIRHD